MRGIVRIVIASALLLIAAFMLFGFLATFEPPGFVVWRITYVSIGLIALGAATWLLIPRVRSQKND